MSPRSFELIITALSVGSLKRFLDHEGGTPRKCNTPLRQLTFLRMSHLFCSQQIPVPSVVTKSDGTPGCLAFHPPEFQAKKPPLFIHDIVILLQQRKQTKTAVFIRVVEPRHQVAVVMKTRSQLQVHKLLGNY